MLLMWEISLWNADIQTEADMGSVCMSKGPRALCLTAIGADIVWCLHVYAASSWVPM